MALLHRLTMYIPSKMILGTRHLQLQAPSFSLDAAGLVALADLTTVQARTALTGTATLLDALVICPGIHLQQRATELNGGEYPACGAMTTGYVFRVENPATVYYLQNVGRTGQLTTLAVTRLPADGMRFRSWIAAHLFSHRNATAVSCAAYLAAVLWALAVVALLALMRDWWGLGVVGILVLSRACNVVVIRLRNNAAGSWTGAREPGAEGDLLILLSQDRWVRMRGYTDDLKAVTSGQWLRDENSVESWVTAFATLIVYLGAALAANVQQAGKVLLLALMIGSVGLLAVANVSTHDLQMRGCIVKVDGERKPYERRLHLVEELVNETGRDDWAVRMGMKLKSSGKADLQMDGHKVVEM
ncbi:uncharacterized protein BKCO1_5000116 [Diplodia corticola]|uniref:Uncharacterized protein n=1 Tax=Diplodia corticola TaxID=236234 RepID=A0A1J9SBQ8_9PEZI|nr:uncharacterized protein BKCO1_5000116 [Diplodia corticola]OJD37911.1 hypothetical protein BKCO1_5000116 [Diplodia corticola]